jgi:hypothetical protein
LQAVVEGESPKTDEEVKKGEFPCARVATDPEQARSRVLLLTVWSFS